MSLLRDNLKLEFGKDPLFIPRIEDLAKHGISVNDLFDKGVIPLHTELANLFSCDPSVIKSIITDILHIPLHDLVLYRLFKSKNSLLVSEKHYCEQVKVKTHNSPLWRTEHYDVYVAQDPSASTTIAPKIAKHILFSRYPEIFKNPIFCKTEKRFKNKSIFNITLDTKLKDISIALRYDDDKYTVQDLIDVLVNGKDENAEKSESLFSMYYDDFNKLSIYLRLTDRTSLTIPLKAITQKNWDVIGDTEIYNMPYVVTDKYEYFTGKQKNAPYFNHPLINELKKILTA